MTADVLCRYATDGDGRLVFVDEAWCAFAAANDAPEYAAPERLYGRMLLSFISEPTTKLIYVALMQRVVEQRQPVSVPFRCDAPALRRWLELTMTARDDGGIDFVSRQLHSEPRDPPFDFRGAPHGASTLVRMCSWCKNVELSPDTWGTAEEAVRAFGLFGAASVPQVTHGICPPCVARFELDLRR
ncbi:MAG TPA: hypothetical protein VFK57_08730 [Vicinamibacterales bacterium]|nr:hypothetical protein [Vicinamibacterales bacterium]